MDKILTKLCLEIVANVRWDLSEDDLRLIGYENPQCPLGRRQGDDGWYGTVKPPAGIQAFHSPARIPTEVISGLAIDALIRQLDSKPPVRKNLKPPKIPLSRTGRRK